MLLLETSLAKQYLYYCREKQFPQLPITATGTHHPPHHSPSQKSQHLSAIFSWTAKGRYKLQDL